MLTWYLEGAAASHNTLLIPLAQFPFRIGRDPASDLSISSGQVSKHHALIDEGEDDWLKLVDLNSTNGSFVNRARIQGSAPIREGDILHFGNSEFRLRYKGAKQPTGARDSTATVFVRPDDMSLPLNFVPQEHEYMELLEQNRITAHFQPIVRFSDESLYAYEALGRGNHDALPKAPMPLFVLAEALGKEVALSEAFRYSAAQALVGSGREITLFVNSHPKEMFKEALYTSLERIMALAPQIRLVLEVHETAVTEAEPMKVMVARLKQMGIRFAYDDFGAGQSRLNELADTPPDVVKFDIALVRDLYKATDKKQKMISDLVRIVHDMGSITLAEGIEAPEDAAICKQMGFQLVQGFLYGRPMPVEDLLKRTF
jgi:EAL domain-containing protein (putative c-di-GMP-specific phosphodiesterase class I)